MYNLNTNKVLLTYLFALNLQQEDLDAARKKTDESSPDDREAEGEEGEKEGEVEGEGENEVGPGGDNKKTKKSKAALEEQEEEVYCYLIKGELIHLQGRWLLTKLHVPFVKGVYSEGKNLLPQGANCFLLEKIPFQKWLLKECAQYWLTA